MEYAAVREAQGVKVVHVVNGLVEICFDWELIPAIDLEKEYYLVRLEPDHPLSPVELARPNSSGPLYFKLHESVTYQISLIRVPYLSVKVWSDLQEMPWVDLTPQHENLFQLSWGNLDPGLNNGTLAPCDLRIQTDSGSSVLFGGNHDPVCQIQGRPTAITVHSEKGRELFKVTTNLAEEQVIVSLNLLIEKSPTLLTLSTVATPLNDWKVRAEINSTFHIHDLWERCLREKSPELRLMDGFAAFRFYEDEAVTAEIRQFGFCTWIRDDLIEKIQLEEWNFKQREPVTGYKLQLQISSAHRELFRFSLAEKQYSSTAVSEVVGFAKEEVRKAEQDLFEMNKHISWDQAHLELVLFFHLEGKGWQEFQRDNAHNLRWDLMPKSGTKTCRAQFVFQDIEGKHPPVVLLESGLETRINWPRKVVLKPFSSNRLVAWWDLDQQEVEQLIKNEWKVTFDQVGFFLKVHEEYLGTRRQRGDLEVQIPELFSKHQNIYFSVDPDKCYSVEIVARHYQAELALTPVSKAIISPRVEAKSSFVESYRGLSKKWFHPSQRQVHHQNGTDAKNRAKVLFHLHFHSPNLFRADPFRESYLRDIPWPIRTAEGAEVHNPPGEWATRNCLDSWLPLLRSLRKLASEGVDYQLSLNISPPVAYMLNSPRFKDYMSRYLLRLRSYVKGQLGLIKARRDPQELLWAAERYLGDLEALDLFYNQDLQKDMIGAFRTLEEQGYIEIATCTATHGMPAELESLPDSLNTQIVLATRFHQNVFGNRPHGIWLAENSYFPGVEAWLSKEELTYFFIESEAALMGSQQPREQEFSPLLIPGQEVVAFPRSRLGRTQVWDAKLGYAGHPDFREYHFRHLGLPIKRITSKDSNDKAPYHPDKGEQTARELAWDFHNKLVDQARKLQHIDFRSAPLICCSYDAELFGHHWSEGPIFLEEFLREFYRKTDEIGLTTPSHYLADSHQLPEYVPNPSTWGHEAVHVRWSDPMVIWTYKELERAEWVLNTYLGLALEGKLKQFQKELVNQMAAELVRAQSSDLTFVIISGDFEEDMQREILKYLDYFYRLKYLIDNEQENREFLTFRQYENDMFPEIPAYYNIQ